jgi:anthranilate synthase/aminodeoxychorismate synthase-like glutamine amidotransferase
MILLIDNYDSFTFNLYQLVSMLGYECKVLRNNAVSMQEIARLAPQALMISPGPGHPGEAGVTLEAIETFAGKIPIFGVCLGHQAIAQVFGGKVIRAPQPCHGKLSKISHDGSGIYRGLAQNFTAARYHSLVVERSSLPSCLEVTAETGDGLIMGLRHRSMNVQGVQFHPESIASQSGAELIGSFLKEVAA